MGTINKYIIFILIIIIFTSCMNGDKTMNIIAHGTSAFDNYIKNVKVSPIEAFELKEKFCIKNKICENKKYSSLFFIVQDNYVFTNRPLSKMEPKGKLLKGIWVNTNTGESSFTEDETFVNAKSLIGWTKPYKE